MEAVSRCVRLSSRAWKALPVRAHWRRYPYPSPRHEHRLDSDVRIGPRNPGTRLRHACFALVFGAAAVDAAVAAELDVRALAAGCASCHAPDGRQLPPLAGQPRGPLASRLRAFRDGTRPGTVMPRIAHGYTIAELDALAAYYAAQPAVR